MQRELAKLLAETSVRADICGFAGAPGWTVLRTNPPELLLEGPAPLLVRLASRLGVSAFQYNVYDGDSHFLFEVDADGHVERSGYVGVEPTRYWGTEPPEDRLDVRFHIVDPTAPAAWAATQMPEARVTGLVPAYQREPAMARHFDDRRASLLRWLEETHGRRTVDGPWQHHPSHVVRALASAGKPFLSIEGVTDAAIMLVFGGENWRSCEDREAPLPARAFRLTSANA